VPAGTFRFGMQRLTLLKRLKTSYRRVADMRPETRKPRERLMSKLFQLGPRSAFRGSSPKTPEGTDWNAAGLNHESTVFAPSGSPTRFGMPNMLVPTLFELWLTVKGRPERHA